MTQNTTKATPFEYEILEQTPLHQGHITLVKYLLRHRLFSGEWSRAFTREVLASRHAVGVLLYDPARDEVVLIEEFRAGVIEPGSNPWLLGIVAGLLEKDETPEEVAKREAIEEANCAVSHLQFITRYWVSPSISAEKITLYCAQIDASHAGGIYGLPEEGEDIRVTVLSRQEAYQAVLNGRINNSISIIALQWLQLHYLDAQQQWLANPP